MKEEIIKLIPNNIIILAEVDQISECAVTPDFTCDVTPITDLEDFNESICIIPEQSIDDIQLIKTAIEQTQVSLYLYIEYKEGDPELTMNESQFNSWLEESKQTLDIWLPKLYQLNGTDRNRFAERNINIFK